MQLKPAYPLENGRLLISCRPSARFQCQLCPVIISDLLRLFSDWATTMNHAWARVPMSRSRELDIISTKPLCMKDPSTNINFEYVRIQSMTIRDSQVESQRAVLSQRWLDNSPLATSRGKSWTSWRKTNLKIIVNPNMVRHQQCFIWITMACVCLFCWFVHPNH